MGDIADDTIDFSSFAEDHFEEVAEAQYRLEYGIWRMRDGKEIHISRMDNNHINNTIAMMNRNKEKHPLHNKWKEKLEAELKRRPTSQAEWNP
jgi:hypothetical protein|tara:strand:+ start:287 stop:565 length:279 start_codon:yes stop_codon:yes gene_type:complete